MGEMGSKCDFTYKSGGFTWFYIYIKCEKMVVLGGFIYIKCEKWGLLGVFTYKKGVVTYKNGGFAYKMVVLHIKW
jgi:hypothetical protein